MSDLRLKSLVWQDIDFIVLAPSFRAVLSFVKLNYSCFILWIRTKTDFRLAEFYQTNPTFQSPKMPKGRGHVSMEPKIWGAAPEHQVKAITMKIDDWLL